MLRNEGQKDSGPLMPKPNRYSWNPEPIDNLFWRRFTIFFFSETLFKLIQGGYHEQHRLFLLPFHYS